MDNTVSAKRRFTYTLSVECASEGNADLDAVGKAAMFLVSDNSLSTTGEIIYVDGGYHVMGLPILENL